MAIKFVIFLLIVSDAVC